MPSSQTLQIYEDICIFILLTQCLLCVLTKVVFTVVMENYKMPLLALSLKRQIIVNYILLSAGDLKHFRLVRFFQADGFGSVVYMDCCDAHLPLFL